MTSEAIVDFLTPSPPNIICEYLHFFKKSVPGTICISQFNRSIELEIISMHAIILPGILKKLFLGMQQKSPAKPG
ncbi:hypothetical protein A4H97_01560 [Niastella yeongjuensis]|uniref:Uncharacterized protein n=1 Tax=Niastella yeongjuensis TaxID=354355 RepID=A0A1V9EXD4_9BACT|nr:hypothetical protein A4H97_01560 [Niastella yeongjuensis]SEN29047.1 hypothetical protein SAMN05660816_00633 [Niastella yeongjuensis]